MTHTFVEKQPKRILVITVSDPFDFRAEPAKIMSQLNSMFEDITEPVYVIYDIRKLSISFSNIIDGVAGFARPGSDFEKKLNKYGRMILVGSGTLITVTAKTAARFSPERPFPVFGTPEEAIEYAKAEIAKEKEQERKND